VCNMSLLYFSVKFAINKIYRPKECMMEMMTSCSAVILLKYLVLNLNSPKDWIHCSTTEFTLLFQLVGAYA